jgi:hypothetical protein
MVDIQARLTLFDSMVTNTLPTLRTQYTTMVNAGTALRNQNTGLQTELRELQTKQASLQTVADTYDREFLDRGGRPPKATLWSRRGFHTFQDWLLGAFFLIYALVSLALLVYVVVYSKKKLQGGAIVLSVAVILGIIMVGLIARFA